MSRVGDIGKDTLRGICNVRDVALREKQRLFSEIGEVRGLIPLLVKPRKHRSWTRADKVRLRRHLKRVSRLGPYLFLLVVPGGFIALPALAWWRDRHHSPTQPTDHHG